MPIWLIVLIIVIAILFFWVIGTYNSLVTLRNRVKDQWAQIDVQLKRRFDLIPNLVEVVKGYAKHEKSTFEDVVKARNTFSSATNKDDEIKANAELTKSISKLMMLVENYPELKANDNFMSLQNDLTDTENKISMMRQFYNDTVMNYNNKVEKIPSNIVANIFGFKGESFFEVNDDEKTAPKVSFE